MRGKRPRWLLWAAALVVPLGLAIALSVRDFEYEDVGSSCRVLTDAGKAEFADAVLGLQLSLIAWVIAGGALVLYSLLQFEDSPGAWVTIVGWVAGVVAAVVMAWYAPTVGGFGKLILAVVYTPVIVAACFAVMAVGLAARRRAFPVGLLLRSQAVLVAMLAAGALLGGTGEVEIC